MNSATNFEDILVTAMNWGKTNYPNASTAHHCAFANSVAYLVTGASGGYGGPSLREHAVSWSLAGDGDINTEGITLIYPDARIPHPGTWEFEKACEYCAPICFGVLPAICKRISQNEHYFDDDPADLALLESM